MVAGPIKDKYRGLSTTATKAPPSVEMTRLCGRHDGVLEWIYEAKNPIRANPHSSAFIRGRSIVFKIGVIGANRC